MNSELAPKCQIPDGRRILNDTRVIDSWIRREFYFDSRSGLFEFVMNITIFYSDEENYEIERK